MSLGGSLQKEDLILKVFNFIKEKKLIDPGDSVLASVSGGPDSVFLLFALKNLKEPLEIEKLGVLHINHLIRETAERDQAFVERLAKELSLEFICRKVDVKDRAKREGISLEEAGKLVREEIYQEIKGWDRIALGHTMDDQLETLIMRIFRGSSIKGLMGIPARRGKLIRPLLCLRKEEILKFLEGKGIDFMVDETNISREFLRNRIRLDLIPLLTRIFGTPYPAIKISEDMELIWSCMEDELKKFKGRFLFRIPDGISFYPLERLKKLPDPVKMALLEDLEEKGFSRGFKRGLFREFLKLLDVGKGEIRVGRKRIVVERDLVFVLDDGFKLRFKTWWSEEKDEPGYPFLKEDIPKVEVRRFRPGDRVYIRGLGRKKLKKLFQEKGIPRILRRELPVVTLESEIVWIPFVYRRDREIQGNPIYLNIEFPASLKMALHLLP